MPYLPDNHYCCVCNNYLGMDDGDGVCSTCEEVVSIHEKYAYRANGGTGKFHLKNQNNGLSTLCNWRLMIYAHRPDLHEKKDICGALSEGILCRTCMKIYNDKYI